jgi:hypothetical protein
MGFPPWTLWGMGFSVLGAIITLALSLLAQSPQALKRIGLGSSELNRRARSFTTYAFALLILGLGFFLAGVPIGPGEQTAAQTTDPPPTITPSEIGEQPAAETEDPDLQPAPPLTPETGAFGGPPPELASPETISGSTTISATAPLTGTIVPEPTLPVDSATAEPTNTVEATATPEPTLTPTPTVTPLPTLTPTPISGQTAVIDIGGGNVWLLRSPGGQNLVILGNGETVIVLDGRANQGGSLWQEIMNVNGVVGWIQEEFLVFDEG